MWSDILLGTEVFGWYKFGSNWDDGFVKSKSLVSKTIT